MLADPLVLKDTSATDLNFDLVSTVVDQKTGLLTTTRTDRSRSETEPRKVVIKSNITGSGPNRVRRVTILGSDTQLNAAGVPSTATFQGSWVFPLNGEFASTDLDNLIVIVSDLYLSTAALAVDATKRAALQQGQA